MRSNDIKRIIKDIFRRYGFNEKQYKLDYDLSTGNGYCEDLYYNGRTPIHIGIRELKGISNKELSNSIFIKIIINTFHEIKHFIQQQEYFNKNNVIKDDNFKTQMFFNHLACIGGYYGYYSNLTNLGHYFNNIREIDAERYGISKAYEYLSVLYPKEELENLIISYVNNKINTPYFIRFNTPIRTLKEIDILFEKAINKTLYKKNMYIPEYINKDEPIKYIQSINNDFVLQVNDYPASVKQDKVLAGAYIKYIEDKNIHISIKDSYLYKEYKDKLLKIVNDILYYKANDFQENNQHDNYER